MQSCAALAAATRAHSVRSAKHIPQGPVLVAVPIGFAEGLGVEVLHLVGREAARRNSALNESQLCLRQEHVAGPGRQTARPLRLGTIAKKVVASNEVLASTHSAPMSGSLCLGLGIGGGPRGIVLGGWGPALRATHCSGVSRLGGIEGGAGSDPLLKLLDLAAMGMRSLVGCLCLSWPVRHGHPWLPYEICGTCTEGTVVVEGTLRAPCPRERLLPRCLRLSMGCGRSARAG
mmetsp:Transcript_61732/g.133752  ORF Transcript_61732/g.133752 Transcript_61732/m.133752 type:complete len:232 (-) Transcript_61732:308-1003(-)